MGISYMTREGYLKLERELNELVKVKRKEIAAKIEHARSFGDIRENAEYHAVKEEQAMLEQKIGQLSARLSSAQIIDNMDIPDDKAYVGATVKLKDLNSEEMMEYMLVSEAEADILENKLSVTSPVGKALLGKSVNEVVEIEVPAGLLKYQLTEIRRL